MRDIAIFVSQSELGWKGQIEMIMGGGLTKEHRQDDECSFGLSKVAGCEHDGKERR
jgi:hypothetical protein